MFKRNFVFILLVVFSMMLTACGPGKAAATSAPKTAEVDEEFHGEGEVQGAIKSDDEIAALQAEEEQYASEASSEPDDSSDFSEDPDGSEDPINVDNTGHEPEAYGSGNFQDYWQGEDYFDIVSYLRARGCTEIRYYDDSTSETDDESKATFYVAFFNGHEWEIDFLSAVLSIKHITDNYDTTGTPEYMILDDSVSDINISLSKTGPAKASLKALQNLDITITYIINNSGSLDPLNGSGLNYVQTK